MNPVADTSVASDADLITRAREGDEDAFAALWERHEAAARRLAGTYARNDADRDDLVSIAFERVLGAVRNGGGPDESFRAYLFVTLRRAAAEAAKRREELPPQGLIDLAIEADEPPLEGEERELITRAFASLPDRWQTVLWHTAVEGRAPRELAPRLGVSPNAAAAMAYRAREKLRQAYLQAHLQQAPRPGCEPHTALLGSYVRGALSARDHRAVEAHLEHCEHCQALVAELHDVNSLLLRAVLPILAVGGAKAAAVAGGAAAGGTGGLAVVRWLSGRSGPGPQAGAVAGAAAAVVAVVMASVALAGGFRGDHHHTQLAAERPAPSVAAPAPPSTAPPATPTTAAPTTVSPTTTSTTVPPTSTSSLVPAPRAIPVPTTAPDPPVTTPRTAPTTTPPPPSTAPPTAPPTPPTTVPTKPVLWFGGSYSHAHPGLRSTSFLVGNRKPSRAATGLVVVFAADHGAVSPIPGGPGWNCGPANHHLTCRWSGSLAPGQTTNVLGWDAPGATKVTITATTDQGATQSVTLQ